MQAKGKKGKKGKVVVSPRKGEAQKPNSKPESNEITSRNAANENQFSAANKRVSFDNQKEIVQQTLSPRIEPANLDPSLANPANTLASSRSPGQGVENLSPRKMQSSTVVPMQSKTASNTAQKLNQPQKNNLKITPATVTKPQFPGSTYSPSQRQNSYSNEEQSLASTRPLWRTKYDANQVYTLDQTFKMSCPQDEHMREIKRWNNNDIKGRRQAAFVKEVACKNAGIMTIVPQTRLERAHKYTDGHKLLNFRKKIMKIRIQISEFANMITSSKYFEGFIILIIGLNCITLAGSDSTKEETPTEKSIDLIFNIVYTIEMTLRIFSLGFIFNEGSYLRSMWCQLDFICVCTALLEYVGGGGGSLGALRAFRVLRPLRFVNNIQGLKSIVQSIMAAIPMLKNTLVVLFFFFLIFAIGGLNLFMGLLKQRCIDEWTGVTILDEGGEEMLCGSAECPIGTYCGKTTLNPNYDVTNFDNIFWALLNVFQCVTMEGWSEIMVMYQIAYSPLMILFFVPLVFLGAFFLLNLNLAVIQTKYSETQNNQKVQKEKDALELEKLTQAVQSSNKTDAEKKEDDEAGNSVFRMGVAEYYIAKRAARKLKNFWIRHKQQKILDDGIALKRVNDDKIAQKKQEETDRLRRTATKRRKSILVTNNQPKRRGSNLSLGSSKGEDVFKDFTVGEDKNNTEELEDVVSKQFMDQEEERNRKKLSQNSSIREDEEESYDDAVQQFLKDINNGTQEDNSGPKNAGQTGLKNKLGIKGSAYNDVRISQASRGNKIFTGIDRTQRPKNEPQMNNFTVMKEKVNKIQFVEQDMEADSMHDKILRDLDFDKVVVQREFADEHMTDPATKHDFQENKAGNKDNFSDIDHPLDLSFTKDINQDKRVSGAGYASDKHTPSESDDGDSISLSDESIARKIDQLHEHADEDFQENNPFSRTVEQGDVHLRMQRKQTKIHQSNEINKTFKRMLTVGHRKKDNMNETQSTFLGNQPSAKQQIEIFSNFHNGKDVKKIKRQISLAEKEKNDETREQQTGTRLTATQIGGAIKPNDAFKIQKEKRQLIEKIDKDYFTTEKPQDPLLFINKMTEKSAINAGVVYESTSQKEIFEIRNKLRAKEYLSQMNQFIAPPEEENDGGLYEGKQEESYINVRFDAYQLKTLYKVKDQEDVEIDSDDEDAVVLQPQPYETAMSIGFEPYLNHLSTKFIARRSDIIVSSTLSITLTPIDNTVEPCHFATVNSDEIWNYVTMRQEYRSSLVKTAQLPKTGQQQGYDSVSSIESKSKRIEDDSDFSEFDSAEGLNDDAKLGKKIVRIPDTLLSEQLDKKRVNQLTERQKRQYLIQKNKYDQKKQKLENRRAANEQIKIKAKADGEVPKLTPLPKDVKISLQDAKDLVNGLYKHEDDDDEEKAEVKITGVAENGALNLGRAMTNGAPNDPQHEINLEGFDDKVANALWDNENTSLFDPRMLGDHVPSEIKQAFGLPKDMSSYDIDFTAVRNDDAQFKKRQPIWSGQDVLEIGLTKAKSNWILKKMNLLRVWPKGFFRLVKKFRTVIKDFTRLSLFGGFLTSCVLVNTIGMAMDSYDIDAKTQADLEFQNLIFTYIFIVEMALRLLAVGPKKYSGEVMNLLDGGVVILSIVEILMSALGGGSGAGSLQAFRTIRVFRTFRVLRVTRLLRGLQSMAMVIRVIGKSFMDFILITILMFVFIFIYTLLGRQIFQGAGELLPGEDLPRANYESFSVAFVTVFQVLTMENWQQVLFASMKASNNEMLFKTVTSIYYISWIFIGNFILLNLFLAILIDAFNEEEDEDEDDISDAEKLERKQKAELATKLQKAKRMKKLGTSVLQMRANTMKMDQEIKPKKKKTQVASFTGKKQLREDDLEDIEDMTAEEIRALLVKNGHLKAQPKDNIDPKEVGEEIHADNSIYLFSRENCFRRNIHFIQKHKKFENFIMLLIGFSSIKLATESYFVDEPEGSTVLTVSEDLDKVFNHCFNVECVLKILALGFAMDEGSYLRDSWNKLDFFIVVTSNIDMILANTDIPALKVLRMLRMIRPLRVISHNPQLKMIVAALAKSVAPIGNVAVIVMIIWLMFAIYGMNTFMGMFFYCTEEPYTYGTQWVCEDHGGEWKKFDSNFDDIGGSMTTLFIVASLEGWPDIMYQAIDVTKTDNGPKKEASPAQSGFFIIFILIGSFFFLNFFIGVLFLEYEKAERQERKGFTHEMLHWKELQNLIVEAKVPHELRYKPQDTGVQLTLHKLVDSDPFDIGIMICIVLNMMQMALDHEGASPGMLDFLKVTNYIFTTIFLLECILKLYVYRRHYFKTAWNKFDFFVVSSSIIDLGLEFALPKSEGGQDEGGSAILSVGPQLARVLRVLRVSRVLRLAGKAKELQGLLKTIMMSVESLFNVFILLMLIFFISAVLGNTMFYKVKQGDVISEYKNFNNFHQSFSLLFSISTGEDWNRIMFDTMRLPPDCIEGLTCGSSIAPVFFLTFIMVVTNVMLNLFILVIIQNFTKYYLEPDNPLSCFEVDSEDFIKVWKNYTGRYQCTKIKPKWVAEFLKELPSRMRNKLEIFDDTEDSQINKIVLKMNLAVTDDGYIFFNEMLYRVMHCQYVSYINLKLNRVMTVQELVTQYRIAEITYQNQQDKKLTKKDAEEVFLKQMNAAPVNLFLTRMFYKTSFKVWHKQIKLYLDKKDHEKRQKVLRDKAEVKGDVYHMKEFVPKQEQPKKILCEYEKELVFTISNDEAQLYRDDLDDLKSQKSETYKPFTQQSNQGPNDSPSNFRQHARNRLISNNKKYPKFMGEEVEMSQKNSLHESPQKRMLIAHSPEEAAASVNHQFVDPNSEAYQNVVMESKINKHEKIKSKRHISVFKLKLTPESSMIKSNYKGSFSAKESSPSPSRVNDPLWESRRQPKKKKNITFSK